MIALRILALFGFAVACIWFVGAVAVFLTLVTGGSSEYTIAPWSWRDSVWLAGFYPLVSICWPVVLYFYQRGGGWGEVCQPNDVLETEKG